VRSGNLAPYDGKSWNAGQNGYEWSSRGAAHNSTTSASAYYLAFNGSTVYPSASYDRWYGFPLRCLSTVLGMWRGIG